MKSLALAHRAPRLDGSAMCGLALVLLLIAAPTSAATIAHRDVTLELDGNTVCSHEVLTVKLETPGDLKSWSEYVIPLNAFTELRECVAEVLDEGGEVLHRVPAKKRRRLESPGYGMYSSGRLEIVPFPPLAVGRQLRLDVTTCSTPPYPANTIRIVGDTAQDQLVIKVKRDPKELRWKLTGSREGVSVAEEPGMLIVRGSGLPAWDPPRYAPPSSVSAPALRVAWGGGAGWKDVGEWYSGLVGSLPPPGPAVAAKAESLCGGLASRRDKVEALVGFVKHAVRYVAVEIGDGTWKPSPPEEVLARGWGDCKDKAYLLETMLEAVGIRSHLVLINAGRGGRFDTGFASPFWFNHCITAAEAPAAGAREGDPVVDGLLLVDPTVRWGKAGWLPPSVQGRPALLAEGAGSRLIEVPDYPGGERRSLVIQGSVNVAGGLTGTARLELRGTDAVGWLVEMSSSSPSLIASRLRRALRAELRGCTFSNLGWREVPGDAPTVSLTANIDHPRFARGRPGARMIALPAPGVFPDPQDVRDRSEPLTLGAGLTVHRWTLGFPKGWCLPRESSNEVENSAGLVRATVSPQPDGTLVVERAGRINEGWITGKSLLDLLALARAESRFCSRHLRLRCPSRRSSTAP